MNRLSFNKLMYFKLSSKSNSIIENQKSYISAISIVLLFTALTHHAVFCFINTNFFGISAAALVLTELISLVIIFSFFIRSCPINYVVIILFIIANAFVLAIFQQAFDPKGIRNFILPIMFIWLGSQYDNRISVDTLIKWMAWIFLAFGLFELLLADVFQSLFNILNFQIAMGRNTEESLQYASTSFSLNGTRYGGRNVLSFLGDHRVASLFLETVNTSNFSTLLVAWGLSKKKLVDGWQPIIVGILIALLADSRFGLTLITLMFILRLFLHHELLKYFSYFSPVIFLLVCFYFGWSYTEFRDDFETRLGSTGYFIMNFKPLELFGLSSFHYSTLLDQGYARLFHFNGLVLAAVLWVSFCRLTVRKDAEMFKYLVAVIISANLAISGDSVFAFKWVVIMWFLIGTILIKKLN